MESSRAREIYNSLGVIEVTYQGKPVWIESLADDTAVIEDLLNGQQLEVPVSSLEEVKI